MVIDVMSACPVTCGTQISEDAQGGRSELGSATSVRKLSALELP
jgi:hypothetical protein